MLCPSADRSAPALPLCHTKLGGRTAVLPCALLIPKDKCLLTLLLPQVRMPQLLKSEWPSLSANPFSLHPGPLLSCHLGRRQLCSFLGSGDSLFLLGKPPCHNLTNARCHREGLNTWQEHHTATIALAPVLLLCFIAAFPK